MMLAKAPRPLVVLKISGESLRGTRNCTDPEPLQIVAEQIRQLAEDGINCLVVTGGGNIFRGPRDGTEYGLTDDEADLNGMMATGLNANNLSAACRKQGLPALVIGRGPCTPSFGPNLTTAQIGRVLSDGRVCIVAGGSGVSGVSTDVPAVQFAAELGAQKVIMSKFGVNGVYTADPKVDPAATLLPSISASEALTAGLRVMDAKALRLSRQFGVEIHVVAAADASGLVAAARGETLGSVIIPV